MSEINIFKAGIIKVHLMLHVDALVNNFFSVLIVFIDHEVINITIITVYVSFDIKTC